MQLADTTIRLLGQEPLAGRVPTSELLRLAEILDRAGFAYLGLRRRCLRHGGSPRRRARGSGSARYTRASRRHSSSRCAAAFIGSRPVEADMARRFIFSSRERGSSGRLRPLNDVSNLREAAHQAVAEVEREFEAGLVYSPGKTGEVEARRAGAQAAGARRRADRASRSTGSLGPHGAAELVPRVSEASGLPVGVYCQGAGGNAMAAALEAVRVGADLAACAVYPVALSVHRVSGESLATALRGLGLDTGVDVSALWEASGSVDEYIGDQPVTPVAPQVAVRAAEHHLPAGLVAALDANLRAQIAGDRLEEVLDELQRIRQDVGSPPLGADRADPRLAGAGPRPLAQRYLTVVDELRALVVGRYGTPPAAIDPGVKRAIELR